MTITMPYQPLALDQTDVQYAHGPDSFVQPAVPTGQLVEFDWNTSTVYPGTSRKFWVYVPAQYDPPEPASLLVVQDAIWHMDPDGRVRAPVVLDNLIQRGDIPITIAVFVEPGIFEGAEEPKNRCGDRCRCRRSYAHGCAAAALFFGSGMACVWLRWALPSWKPDQGSVAEEPATSMLNVGAVRCL